MNLGELVQGCTFDDVLLVPQFSRIESRDPAVIDLRSRLTTRLMLDRPIVSANMDTVTRAPPRRDTVGSGESVPSQDTV